MAGDVRSLKSSAAPAALTAPSALTAPAASNARTSSRKRVLGVPKLPRHYVPRSRYLHEVNTWLQAVGPECDSSLLLLHGIGCAGKSTLAACAANEAAKFDIDVVFVNVKQRTLIQVLRDMASKLNIRFRDDDEEVMRTEIARRVDDLTTEGKRLVLILDDLRNDSVWWAIECFDFVLATARRDDIGVHCRNFDARQPLHVGGLEMSESEDLMKNILGPDLFKELKDNQAMWQRLRTISDNNSNTPLTINLMASLLKRKHETWKVQGVRYLEQLEDRLDASKKELSHEGSDEVRQTIETDYQYANVYASVLISVNDLPKEKRERYQSLSVFGWGDRIRPVTMARLWDCEAHAWQADDILDDFASRNILTKLGFVPSVEQDEYQLHDILFDVVQSMTSPDERSKQRRRAIAAYSGDRSHAPDSDNFYYCNFAAVCLAEAEVRSAVGYLCRPQYLKDRVRLGLADGLLGDFSATRKKDPDNRLLEQYEGLMKEAGVHDLGQVQRALNRLQEDQRCEKLDDG